MLLMVKLPMLPDCETMPTWPAGGMFCSSAMENEPTSLSTTFTVPRQLGPSRRMPWLRATRTNSACRAMPSGPASAKPEVSTITPRTPRLAQSRTACSVASTGTARMARSGAVGVSSTDA